MRLVALMLLVALTAVMCWTYNAPRIGAVPLDIISVVKVLPVDVPGGVVAARKPHIVWAMNQRLGNRFGFKVVPYRNSVDSLRKQADYLYLSPIEMNTRLELRALFQPQADFYPLVVSDYSVLFRIQRGDVAIY